MSKNKVVFYDFDEYRLDLMNGELLKNGSPIPLTQKSFEILQILIENRSQIFKKKELLNSIWGDCFVEEATLTQHIYMLRKGLRENGKNYIETIPKNGYRFSGEVKEIQFEEEIPSTETNLSMPASINSEKHMPKRRFSRSFIAAGILVFVSFCSLFYYLKADFSKTIPNSPAQSVQTNYTKNVEAHQAYLMGLYHWDSRTEESLKKAISYFQKAIEKDPDFALAYADLADTYALIGQSGMDFVPKDKALSQARRFAEKALLLNPKCSEAMTSLAIIEAEENRVESGLQILKKAIEMNPKNPFPHQRIAWLYAANGQIEKAVEEMSLAQRLSPQSRSINLSLASLLNLARSPDEAMIFSRRLLELDENNIAARLRLAESLEQLKLYDDALSELRIILTADRQHNEALVIASRIYAKNRQGDEARKTLKRILPQAKTGNLEYQIALTYNALGNTEEALRWLKQSVEKNRNASIFIQNDYNLDALRKTSGFDKI